MNIGLGIGIPFSRSILYRALSTSLYLDFVSNETLDSRITFTRASSATRVNSSGLIEAVASNAPRFDYDPVTLQPKGLLIEEQRTNLLTYSEQFGNAEWTIGTGTVTANSKTAPDGTLTADMYTTTGTSAQSIYQSATVTASTSYTVSFYVLLGSLLPSNFTIAIYNNTGASFIAADVIPMQTPTASGWTRISYTFTTPVGCTSVRVYPFRYGPAISSSTFYIWGAQLEAGAFPTSYIPTTTAAATRAADVALMTGANFSSWYRQDEGTLFVDGETAGGTSPGFVAVQNAGLTHFTRITRSFSQAATLVNMAGVDQAAIFSGTTFNTGKFVNIATAYKINDFSQVLNGATAVVDSAGSVPTVDTAQIGGGGYANYLNGHIRRIAYFPRRLSNAELQGITA